MDYDNDGFDPTDDIDTEVWFHDKKPSPRRHLFHHEGYIVFISVVITISGLMLLFSLLY